MRWRVVGALCVLSAAAAAPEKVANFRSITFAELSPLARNDALVERLLSPFARADLIDTNAARTLSDFPIDPRNEKFGIFVPQLRPATGYGLIVWVSPLEQAGMPPGWADTLDREGVIFVTAARSGNGTSPLGRRIPLALTARDNLMRSHPIDPDRIWISGFSGGSRVAQRMALAYPDLFNGAILDGSVDEIGGADLPLPPRKDFERFLDGTSIVLSSGEEDRFNVDAARRVLSNLRRHCFNRSVVEVRRREGHVMMDGRSLAKAIRFLSGERGPASPDDLRCRQQLYAKVNEELARAESFVERGDREARDAVLKLDQRYGRLAAPRSLELRARIGGRAQGRSVSLLAPHAPLSYRARRPAGGS